MPKINDLIFWYTSTTTSAAGVLLVHQYITACSLPYLIKLSVYQIAVGCKYWVQILLISDFLFPLTEISWVKKGI